jgi:allantoinase
VTTLLDMPLNSVPATTKSVALERKRSIATGQFHVDVGFFGGVVPGNAADITQLWIDGVFGFKCFLTPSGVDEFPNVTERDLREVLPTIARLRAPLLVHAELPGPISAASKALVDSDPTSYANYLGSRPPSAEVAAVELMLELVREYRFPLHIVHVSAMESLALLRDARAEGLAVTAETCPHYLCIDAEDIPTGATTFKCAPPIRGAQNREALWRALGDGDLDFVVTDHSPCPPELKRLDSGDFFGAWGGIASLELALPVMLTELQRRSLSPGRLTRWMSEAPAQLAGLQRAKGRIAPGLQADFAIVDPTHAFVADPDDLHQRHRITPYAGRTLQGRVRATYLRGQLIYADGDLVGAPAGKLLQRDTRASGQVLKVG